MKRLFAALLIVGCFAASLRADITTGLLLKYAADENTGTTATNTGSLGSGANGTLTAGATWSAPGKVGASCFSFTAASSQYVAIPTESATTAITHACWIYKASTGTMGAVTYGKSMLRVTDTTVVFFPDTDNFLATFTGVTVPLNTWTHLCATQSGTTSRLYVNGVEAGSSPITSGAVGTTTTVGSVGRYAAGNTNFWDGKIDDVYVFSAAKVAADAAQLTALGAAKHSVHYYYLNSSLKPFTRFLLPKPTALTVIR